MWGVMTELFVDRFLVDLDEVPVPLSTFDDERGYAVTPAGQPVVATASAGETRRPVNSQRLPPSRLHKQLLDQNLTTPRFRAGPQALWKTKGPH
jgi:hypothetical protein